MATGPLRREPLNREKETALITGSSTGIGLAFSRILASKGHPLAIVARDPEKLTAVAENRRAESGIPVSAFAKDSAGAHATEQRWSGLSHSKPRIDILVNNAGIGAFGELQHQSLQVLERMRLLKVAALTGLTCLALPEMRRST